MEHEHIGNFFLNCTGDKVIIHHANKQTEN